MRVSAATVTTSRDRVIYTLNHEAVDRAPRDLWVTPVMETLHSDQVAELTYRYPNDVTRCDFRYPRGHRAKDMPNEAGQYADAWGCTGQGARQGVAGEPEGAPLADLRQLAGYRLPWEILEKAEFSAVNRACASSSRFVLAWSDVRPLERMQALHGAEAILSDLGRGEKAARDLLAMLHDFYCRELSLWAATEVDGVVFMDDWGSPQGLATSPEVFRDLFKPLYREYCEILHAKDKFALFRSRGNIEDIFGDLVEIGIDAVNSQLFLMKLDSLAGRFRNRITFWGEIDGQRILPFGTPDEVKAAVRRVRAALDFGRGGLIAQCEWGLNVPFQNVAAAFEQWLAPVPMHAQAK